MKRRWILVMVLGLAVMTRSYGLAQAHGTGSGDGWFDMGTGHMGGSGWGQMGTGGPMMGGSWGHMGSGGPMMGSDWGNMGSEGPMTGSGWDYTGDGFGRMFNGNSRETGDPWRGEHPVTRDQARRVIEYRLGDNPYVRIGQVTDTSDGFQFDIVTKKSEELVDRLAVERSTGKIFPIH